MNNLKYRKHIRLSSKFYIGTGWYFITLVSKKRQNLFTEQIKVILEEALHNIPKMFSGWQIDFFVIMPNHLHFILASIESNFSLDKVIGAYKSLVYKQLRQELGLKESPWQLNYYEHIIRSENELNKIRLYIKANPFEEIIDWKQIDNYII